MIVSRLWYQWTYERIYNKYILSIHMCILPKSMALIRYTWTFLNFRGFVSMKGTYNNKINFWKPGTVKFDSHLPTKILHVSVAFYTWFKVFDLEKRVAKIGLFWKISQYCNAIFFVAILFKISVFSNLIFQIWYLYLVEEHFFYQNVRKKLKFILNKRSYKDFPLNFRGDIIDILPVSECNTWWTSLFTHNKFYNT